MKTIFFILMLASANAGAFSAAAHASPHVSPHVSAPHVALEPHPITSPGHPVFWTLFGSHGPNNHTATSESSESNPEADNTVCNILTLVLLFTAIFVIGMATLSWLHKNQGR